MVSFVNLKVINFIIFEYYDKRYLAVCIYLFSLMIFILNCTDNEIISICKLDQMRELNTLGMTS